MTVSSGDLELRPSTSRTRTNLAITAAVFGALAIGATIAAGLTGLLIAAAVGVVAVLLMRAYLGRTSIVVTADEVVYTGATVRRRPRAQVASVVRAVLVPVRGPWVDNLFFLDAQGGLVLRIQGHSFDTGDLDRLVVHLGVPCTGPDHPVSGGQLGRDHPGILPWLERHPFKAVLAITAGFVAAIVVTVAIVAAATTA